MHLCVGYHAKCMDGLTSAALFTRFYKDNVNPNARITYSALDHAPGVFTGDAQLNGEENAVVDFRYTASPRLTWWFDHHPSAFAGTPHQPHFAADQSGKKFFDPGCSSCTKLIASVAAHKFSYTFSGLEDLITWADTIDAARFESAAVAVALQEPALQLMTVISAGSDSFCDALIPQLEQNGLAVALSSPVQERFGPLMQQQAVTAQRIAQQAKRFGNVFYFDLTAWPGHGFNKFLPYHLDPSCVYAVGVTANASTTKVSVGSNPWRPKDRAHDISKICESYGGGGHAVVGAVTFLGCDPALGQRVGLEIAALLAR